MPKVGLPKFFHNSNERADRDSSSEAGHRLLCVQRQDNRPKLKRVADNAVIRTHLQIDK